MTTEVAFIAGVARSGSTLLAGALSSSLGWIDAGEVVLVWSRGLVDDRPCSCGEAFSSCAFWREVLSTAPELLNPVVAASVVEDTARVTGAFGSLRVMTPRARRRLETLVPARWYAATGALYRGITAIGGTAGLVDSSKLPALAYLLSRTPGLAVRPVHLVRDPRAVAWSWAHPHRDVPGVPDFPSLGPVKASMVWLMINLAAERLPALLERPPERVRYEDLVAELDSTTAPPAHSMAGNPRVRLASEPVRPELDERWRAGSGAATLATVSALSLPRLHRYGYPWWPRRSPGRGRT